MGNATRFNRPPEYSPLYLDFRRRLETGVVAVASPPPSAEAEGGTETPAAPSAPTVVADNLRKSRRFIPASFFARDMTAPFVDCSPCKFYAGTSFAGKPRIIRIPVYRTV